MHVEKVSIENWGLLSEDAHKIAFGEVRPKSMDTYDFVLVCFDDKNILGYATIIEMDKETAYMQHGGAMPGTKGTTKTRLVYHKIIEWIRSNYKRISTRIENKNIGMLKLAMSEGLLVNGCDCYPSQVFLNLKWGFE